MVDKELTAYVRERMPLCATLKIEAEKISPEETILAVDWAEELCTSNGMLHGGTVMALADATGGAAAMANLPDGAVGTSTIESKTNFLGAIREGRIIATSRPLHVGSTTIVIETEVRNNGKLVAKVTQTQTVLKPRK